MYPQSNNIVFLITFILGACFLGYLVLKRNSKNASLMNIERTNTGTFIIDGIEYNHYPPPSTMLKVMERKWAEELIEFGSIRLGSFHYYQKMEMGNNTLGDSEEGYGVFHWNKHPYPTTSGNPVFIWCMSLPEISFARIKEIARSENYNCIIKIISPEELFKRINRSLCSIGNPCMMHCGGIIYNKGEEVSKITLNSQKWHFNVFQKSLKSKPDQEYRIAITDLSYLLRGNDFLKLSIGDCSDIILIDELPTESA